MEGGRFIQKPKNNCDFQNKTEPNFSRKNKVNPGVYIAVEGGRLVPYADQSKITKTPSAVALRSIDKPLKSPQKLPLSSGSLERSLVNGKKKIVMERKIVRITDSLNQKRICVSPDEQKTNFKMSRQRKKLKLQRNGSSTEYIHDTLDQHDELDIREGLCENNEHLMEEVSETEDKSADSLNQDNFNEQCRVKSLEKQSFHQAIPSYSQSKEQSCLKMSIPSSSQKNSIKGNLGTPKHIEGNLQNKKLKINEKFPQVPIPAHINQYGDCLKTRLGRCNYGVTLNDPPNRFFQGVIKGASGQALAVMFGDINLIAKLGEAPPEEIGHFMIDTTFKVTPKGTEGVSHLFTISLLHQNVVIPVWYAVTSCSSAELYKRILIEFYQHVLDWRFTSVLVDDDPALCKALRVVFPDIDIYGSWFHYCYSIWKEINLHKLTEQCREINSALLKAVKLLMVIPYLPPSPNDKSVSMADGFDYIQEFAVENHLPEEFNQIIDYIDAFWFDNVKPENFTLFGKHTHAMNHIEVLQLLLLSFMKEEGNIWTLTRSLQTIAKPTYTDFVRFLNGKKQILMKNRGKKFSVSIRLNIRKLMAGSIDMKTFLEMSTLYLEEILDIFLHPLYPTSAFEKRNYIHTEGWAVRICSE